MPTLDALLSAGAPPIVAILRGLTPAEAPSIGAALVQAGIRIIEVPLNSPQPLDSVAALQASFGDAALIGAGTVLDAKAVDAVAATGARLIVTPNCDPAVIAHSVSKGLETMPGVMTPTEAFAAVRAGARRLKLFPAGYIAPGFLKAIAEVLPAQTRLWAVGGTNADNLHTWLNAGAEGVGVGGALYRPGATAQDVARKAEALVAAWRAGA